MKIFLSSLNTASVDKSEMPKYANVADMLVKNGVQMKWNLLSFEAIRNDIKQAEFIRDNSELILMDSGAFSLQKGSKVEWDKYADAYADFIKQYDRPNVLGYFELDVDNLIGYDNVLKLRKRLESVTDKIIPVWHRNRGIDEYKKMCRDYAGKIVAIASVGNHDVREEQYIMFLKYARQCGCRLHCLGMTRARVLDHVPFDFTDSSSWLQNVRYGRVAGKKVTKQTTHEHYGKCFYYNYLEGMEMQEKYYKRWKKVCND